MPYADITKNAMARAMKDLMREKDFVKISIGDICDRCGMNRKSFYYHFKDKYDLVNWIFQTEFLELLKVRDYGSGWELLKDICVYLYSEKDFYNNALRYDGQNSFRDYFSASLNAILAEIIRDQSGSPEESDFFITFFTDAFLAAILRWLHDSPVMPPERFIHNLESVFKMIAVRMK